ncbi:uncharacterized protein TNCV_2902641 [Trichonephila clavipes]|nr:uncharacterized protein TNCV_2902641 [Trichonephila clavipes]
MSSCDFHRLDVPIAKLVRRDSGMVTDTFPSEPSSTILWRDLVLPKKVLEKYKEIKKTVPWAIGHYRVEIELYFVERQLFIMITFLGVETTPADVPATVAEWYRYRKVACFVTSSSPVPLKTRRVDQRYTLNLSRAETSSRWCGLVVRRGDPSSDASEYSRFQVIAAVLCEIYPRNHCLMQRRSSASNKFCNGHLKLTLSKRMLMVIGTGIPLNEVTKGCSSPVVKVSDHGRHVMSSSPVPLKILRVGKRCSSNLSRAQTSSCWCGVVVRRGDASSGIVFVI